MSGGFALSLEKFKVKTGVRADAVCRRVALETFNRVVLKTPVDTGRARANWIPAVGSLPTGLVSNVTPPTSAINEQVANFKAGQTIYLANNLPYIQRLEDGWSKQAPAGMVHLTLLEITLRFEAIARDSVKESA